MQQHSAVYAKTVMMHDPLDLHTSCCVVGKFPFKLSVPGCSWPEATSHLATHQPSRKQDAVVFCGESDSNKHTYNINKHLWK